jgi:hypothetical protein
MSIGEGIVGVTVACWTRQAVLCETFSLSLVVSFNGSVMKRVTIAYLTRRSGLLEGKGDRKSDYCELDATSSAM